MDALHRFIVRDNAGDAETRSMLIRCADVSLVEPCVEPADEGWCKGVVVVGPHKMVVYADYSEWKALTFAVAAASITGKDR